MLTRLIAAAAFIRSEGNSAVENYMDLPGVTIQGTAIANTAVYKKENIKDDDLTTYFWSGVNSFSNTLQVDFGATKSVNSFSMLQRFVAPTNKSEYDVYIGAKNIDDPSYRSNTKCKTNVM